jgi:acetyl esterase
LIALLDAGFPKLGEEVTDAAQARALLAAQPAPPVEPAEVGRVENRLIAGAEGPIPARIYWPAGSESAGGMPLPLIVFFHGGGFVLCDLDTHDAFCRNLANMADAVVLSVDYRLAPETPYPGGLEDAYAATFWAYEHASELGADPQRLAVAGDSSGGNFAAVVSMLARDRGGPPIVFQFLIYPVTDQDFDNASYRENGAGYFTTATHMRWYCEQYGGDGDDPSGLPPARVITAEFDPLRDEGEAYARRLSDAGVEASVRRFDGMFHGFFTFSLIFPPGQTANEEELPALRERLHSA